MAQLIYTYDNPPSERDLKRACQVLAGGGLIAYQTDLNWAFGCDATSLEAISRIRILKPNHSSESPFTILCDSISSASDIGHIDTVAFRYLKKAWPGPFTVLLTSTRVLPKHIRDKRKVVGIRIPNNNMVRALITQYGKPLLTTSAPGKIFSGEEYSRAPKFGYEIDEAYGHLLDLILDLGTEVSGQSSTVISFQQGFPELIRKGAGDPKIFDLD